VATNIIKNSPDERIDNADEDLEGGVAAGDGVLSSEDVAAECLDAVRNERFLVLPHPEVATYAERKGADRERWLGGMRRFQGILAGDGPLPGDAMAPKV